LQLNCNIAYYLCIFAVMIARTLSKKAKQLIKQMPVLVVTGPRQSGKTTLIKSLTLKLPYVNLEDIETRELAENDIKGFINQFKKGAIIDEAQNVPKLFSQIQVAVDDDKTKRFILSGSQNFSLNEKISQSLAGRSAILTLLPFSKNELQQHNAKWTANLYPLIYKGFYPRLYDNMKDVEVFYNSYLTTYVERDVRKLMNIENIGAFNLLVKLLAGRIGQLSNFNELSNSIGVSYNTIKNWVSLLEQSYIIYQLPPYYNNYKKRLTKSSKIYFYDTGLACRLLGITEPNQIALHFAKGGLFENFVIIEYLKKAYNQGKTGNQYFWRTSNGLEVDLLLENNNQTTAIEIKANETMKMDYFKSLNKWAKISGNPIKNNTVVYAGDNNMKLSEGELIGWKDV